MRARIAWHDARDILDPIGAVSGRPPAKGSRSATPRAPRSAGRAAVAGRWASVALIVAGVAARLAEYWSGRSLWLDESFLWITLDRAPASALAGPLDLAQGAPIPFLLAEKGMLEVFGDGEWALRLLPLVCGIATLVVAQRVAARVLSPERAWIVVAPLALGQAPVFYANEMKQYALDIFVATLLLWVLVWAAQLADDGAPGHAAGGRRGGGRVVLGSGGVRPRRGRRLVARRRRGRARPRPAARARRGDGRVGGELRRGLPRPRPRPVDRPGGRHGGHRWRHARTTSGGASRLVPGALQYGIGNGLLVPLLAQALVLLGILALWRSGRRVEAGILGVHDRGAAGGGVRRRSTPSAGASRVFLAPALALAFGAGVLAVWDAARARGRRAAVAVAIAGAVCAVPVARAPRRHARSSTRRWTP